MKDFNDLVFYLNPNLADGVRARIFFDNGYGVSVINGYGSYTNGDEQYEVAVIDKKYQLIYDTPVTSNVLGYLEADDVSEVMKQVQLLPKREK